LECPKQDIQAILTEKWRTLINTGRHAPVPSLFMRHLIGSNHRIQAICLMDNALIHTRKIKACSMRRLRKVFALIPTGRPAPDER
jgi:hypothetical protein